MLKIGVRAFLMVFVLTLLTGVIYPLAMTGFAQVMFPRQANGSLVVKDGRIVGSELIGQAFSSERYFHGRPSVAGDNGYDGAASAGSNLGPTSRILRKKIAERVLAVRQEHALSDQTLVPSDLVLTSASGLDPHITPAAAAMQIKRVAAARKMDEQELRALVETYSEKRQWGLWGEPRVNVLAINMALDNKR